MHVPNNQNMDSRLEVIPKKKIKCMCFGVDAPPPFLSHIHLDRYYPLIPWHCSLMNMCPGVIFTEVYYSLQHDVIYEHRVYSVS